MSPLFTATIFGLLAAFLAVIIEIVTSISPLALQLDSAKYIGLSSQYWLTWKGLLPLILLAGIEESIRFVFLRQYIIHFRVGDELFSLKEKILLGLAFGVGFSSLEAFLILNGSDWRLVGPEFSGIIILHTAMSLVFSFLLLKHPASKRLITLLVIGLAIVLHTLYNLGILLYS